ncbi:sigma factor-like helix-turn-helix DNA-binding protein [Photobacterium piscicola]|uniref:RNA polymerase sigma-70 region 4 domain-containing protein n=1 Tax=Photobacterium piscicola TaxID=1378299 RepID=A0ABU6LL59_9GAMM|nr:hypothetical protein [Photobacterium piscicola]
MANIKLTDKDITFITEKYIEGYTQAEIAKALGVTQTCISRVLRLRNVTRKPKEKLTL